MAGHGPALPDAADLAATGNRTLEGAVSPDGTPQKGRRYAIPARQGLAIRLSAGERVRVVNTHGSQVVDFWAFSAADPAEFLSMEHARAALGRIVPTAPAALVTNRRRPILSFLEDTSPGVHDTLIAACDVFRYRGLGVAGYHDNCTDNLVMALHAIGAGAPEVPSPFNLFMNIPVAADGSLSFEPPLCRPGDAVLFEAAMDAVLAFSACPQDILPINGAGLTPVEAHVEVLP